MLERFERLGHRVSRWFEVVGALAILFMMVITCIDVVGAKVFLRPLSGSFDLISLSQLVTVVFAAAFVLILGMHVKIDFFVGRLPHRTQGVIGSIVHMLSFMLFVLIIWRIILYGYELQVAGEVSSEIRIPFYPFAYAIALASIPVCLVLLLKFIRSISEVIK